MDKMKFETPDMTAGNVEKIAELFPNCVTEMRDENGKVRRGINFEVLKQMLSSDVVDGDECYEFTWVGKKASIAEANRPIRKTLRPCPEESKNWDTTENLYIEGDNLEVLKLLQESYLGKVKMIYIDPPYNTGNDFIYADDFMRSQQEENEQMGMYDEDENRLFKNTDSNGRFHSDWCSMMYPRLMLARNLLSDDGVIFISIDDNEVENIKKICDEIFGSSNFIGQWNWYKSATPPNLSYKIKKNVEYILCYEKSKDSIRYKGLQKESPSNDPFTKPQNQLKILTFPPHSIKTSLEDGIYKKGIYGTNKFPNEMLKDLIIRNGTNINEVSFKNRFIWIQDTLDENIKQGINIFLSKSLVLSYKRRNYLPECPPNLIDKTVNVDTTEQAGKNLVKLFDNVNVFDYPKAVSLLKYIIDFKVEVNDIILDFFSGSATTAHAVMQLNAEDNGHRKFIMVQLPEPCDEQSEAYKAGYKNICEIGKERIRRAGEKIKAENGLTAQNLDIGFRVLKLADSNMKDVYYAADDYKQADLLDMVSNIKDDRTDLDLLFGCLIDWGLPLSMPYTSEQIEGCTVHTYNDGDLIACFDENIPESVVKEIASRKPLRAVFRDSSFANSPAKINVFEIFKLYMPEDADDISKRVRVI